MLERPLNKLDQECLMPEKILDKPIKKIVDTTVFKCSLSIPSN